MLKNFFADMHIHIGADKTGQPVKITASRKLNFANILDESLQNKGLDMISIIDCASPIVIKDIENLLAKGEMEELADGGIKYGDLTIILGSEVESREENGGQAHYLAYFPYLDNIKEYSSIMKQYITNINLSSQSTGLGGKDIFKIIESAGGIMVPAHAFTPHKSFYGRSFHTYREIFNKSQWDRIPAVELGLSADSYLADFLSELADKTFLSNSDAHSLGKIAREYNKVKMKSPNFKEFKRALFQERGRKITANYGMDPRLGKYHRSYCDKCNKSFSEKKAVLKCPLCGSDKIIIGVKDRIINISNSNQSLSPSHREQYIHQIPLSEVPGVGSKTLKKLLDYFGTEMNVIHNVSLDQLQKLVGDRLARSIARARSGSAEIKSGGGGVYGKVMG